MNGNMQPSVFKIVPVKLDFLYAIVSLRSIANLMMDQCKYTDLRQRKQKLNHCQKLRNFFGIDKSRSYVLKLFEIGNVNHHLLIMINRHTHVYVSSFSNYQFLTVNLWVGYTNKLNNYVVNVKGYLTNLGVTLMHFAVALNAIVNLL